MRLLRVASNISASAYIHAKNDSFSRRMRLFQPATDIGACACKWKSMEELLVREELLDIVFK